MKSKIKQQIFNALKWLRTWLDNGPVVVYDRPHIRDIHLNSSKAIRIYLAMIDKPLHKPSDIHSDIKPTNEEGGGTTSEELE